MRERSVIRGLIFDFDGLMVDTETSARDSWVDIFQEYGCEFPHDVWAAILGGSGSDFDACGYLTERTGLQLDPEELRARRWRRKLELVAAQPLMPGIADYLAEGKRSGLTLGVASSSSREWVVGHLDRLDVTDLFDAIATGDDVAQVKPDPELYLLALARLGLAASEAVVFEDAPNGVLAAKRASIFTVAVPNALTCDLPLDHADLRVASLADLPLTNLLAAVERHAETSV
ncbi:MAG TPA: HAD-IA family hydrolase [Ktedonobacterales bacterium]|jgi:HAD superfamily hydrolase (TIGR01509 family)